MATYPPSNRDQRLLNNTMSHIKATPTFWCASNLLTLNMMIFLAVGYFLYFEANKLEDFEIRYDNICSSYRGQDTLCPLKVVFPKDIERPKVYYRLNEFYSNHRSFVKSMSYKMLRGNDRTMDTIGNDCSPIRTNEDILNDDWVDLPQDIMDKFEQNKKKVSYFSL